LDVLHTLKDRCDPKYGALVVVDIQNDYISPQGSAPPP
jgi:nicotinamidase-related amidase